MRQPVRDDAPPADCSTCPIAPSRRDFLQQATLAAASAAVALGLKPMAALAESVRFVTATGGSGALKSYSIPAKDGVEIDHANELILVRAQGAVYAFRSEE